MEEYLLYIGYLGLILLIGMVCLFLSKKIRVNYAILLIAAGIVISNIYYNGSRLIGFPDSAISMFISAAAALIMFDSSRKMRFREIDSTFKRGFKVFAAFLILNLALLAVFSYFMINPYSYLLALFFSFAVSEISVYYNGRSRIFHLLSAESRINNFLILLFSWIFLILIKNIEISLKSEFYKIFFYFLNNISIGIIIGIIAGIILFRYLKKSKRHAISPVILLILILSGYFISEFLNGIGIISVALIGIFIGNSYIKDKEEIEYFLNIILKIINIILFILIGFIIKIPDISIIISSIYIFIFYLLLRFLSLLLSSAKSNLKLKEIIYMSLNTPKGSVFAVILLAALTSNIIGMAAISALLMLFLLYSLVLSIIANLFSKSLIGIKVI